MKMKVTPAKLLATSVLAISLVACSQVPEKNTMNGAMAQKDRQQAMSDDRGHKPQPMTETRLQEIVSEYGSNADSTLDWQEYNAWRQNKFDSTDTDKSTTVDAEEYVREYEGRLNDRLSKGREAHIEQTHRRFNALDDNEDEAIDWQEYASSGDHIFERLDVNKDGVVDSGDPEPERQRSRQEEAGGNSSEPRQEEWISYVKMPTTHSRKGFLEIYDANRDGSVSHQEFVNERRTAFHLTDQDHDGALSSSEYLNEFEQRLDTQILSSRHAAIKQTYVRFGVLDDNDDHAMTFEEFQISGKRIFSRWDKNGDGLVSRADVGV